MKHLDEIARRHDWTVVRLGSMAIYSRGSISLLVHGLTQVSRAELKVAGAPAHAVNPKNVPHILKG